MLPIYHVKFGQWSDWVADFHETITMNGGRGDLPSSLCSPQLEFSESKLLTWAFGFEKDIQQLSDSAVIQ